MPLWCRLFGHKWPDDTCERCGEVKPYASRALKAFGGIECLHEYVAEKLHDPDELYETTFIYRAHGPLDEDDILVGVNEETREAADALVHARERMGAWFTYVGELNEIGDESKVREGDRLLVREDDEIAFVFEHLTD